MFKLNDILSGVNGTAESMTGQRVNCRGISANDSIDVYQKQSHKDTRLVNKGQEVLTILCST